MPHNDEPRSRPLRLQITRSGLMIRSCMMVSLRGLI